MNSEIIIGDCMEVMKGFAAESVDLIATDPPYGLSFMGKNWDKAVPKVEIWKECFRVLKHGAFAFVMCAPRLDVQSQMTVRLQQAGFRVDFTPIYWTYASGFPKSENISKAVDKKLGNQREIVGTNPNFRPVSGRVGFQGTDTFRQSEGMANKTVPSSLHVYSLDGSYGGFQPKPAVEVIIVAMKPLSEKTYIEQALKNQKGITWLDEGRIPFQSEADMNDNSREQKYGGTAIFGEANEKLGDFVNQKGRFPANLLVGDDVLNDGRISISSGGHGEATANSHDKSELGYGFKASFGLAGEGGYGDSRSFSRYFSLDAWWTERIKKLPEDVRKTFPFLIIPKASKEERNEALEGFEQQKVEALQGNMDGTFNKRTDNNPSFARNYHPTVKPIQLMSYLITLGSRENDLILDPFCGSGSTCIAARILSRKFIGIEINEDYAKIARARLKLHQEQMKLGET